MPTYINFIPQQIDTVKKFSFDATGNPAPKIDEQTKADSVIVKKKRKNKTEKTEKKVEAAKTKQQSDSITVTQKSASPNKDFARSSEAEVKPISEKHFSSPEKIHLQNREYWTPTIILFSLLIVVWARNSHSNRFARIRKSLFNIREFYQMVREEYAIVNSLSITMMTLFILTLSVFIYQVNSYYNIYPTSSNPFLFFVKIVAFIFLFFICKLVVINILGYIFYNKQDHVSEFIYNISLMNTFCGLALIPIITIMACVSPTSLPTVAIGGFTILVSIYLYRILRTFAISTSGGGVSKLYFFVYLCSLEFLPLVVIFKVIMSRFLKNGQVF
ncbi:MAG: DUF4271 domain-containing protein [Bacteroidia bacterium]|nr:DUF4271 domain-containing protein [Bacteroidia bacterium]